MCIYMYIGIGVLFEEARRVTLDLGQKEQYLLSVEKSLPEVDIVKNAHCAHIRKV